jgi:hypothetical protein
MGDHNGPEYTAFAALGVQAVEARIASALQTFWRSG